MATAGASTADTGAPEHRQPPEDPSASGPPTGTAPARTRGRALFEDRPVLIPGLVRSGAAGTVSDRADCGPFTVYAASQIGGDHETRRRYREDSYAFRGSRDAGSCVVAVADGVSQSHAARYAAEEAACGIVDLLWVSLKFSGMTEKYWLTEAAKAVKILARELPESIERASTGRSRIIELNRKMPADPATTLVFAVLTSDPGEETVYWGAVGDSCIGHVDQAGGRSEFLYEGGSARRNDSRTHALPRDAKALELGSAPLSEDSIVWLGTDGFSKAMYAQRKFITNAMVDVAENPPSASDFLRMVDWKLRGANDDRTVAVVWRHS